MTLTRRRFLAGALGTAGATVVGRPASGAPKELEIICRQAWGAKPPKAGLKPHTVARLTVHHSGRKLTDNRMAPERFRDHQAYHRSLGWPDIAYHVLIDRHGNVYQGRPRWARGDTATDYNPKGHLLVLCEGSFGEQEVSPAQRTALVDVLAWACARYGVKPVRIRGHRDYAATACPGQTLYARIEHGVVRRRVKQRLAGGGVKLLELCGQAGEERVAQIEAGTD